MIFSGSTVTLLKYFFISCFHFKSFSYSIEKIKCKLGELHYTIHLDGKSSGARVYYIYSAIKEQISSPPSYLWGSLSTAEMVELLHKSATQGFLVTRHASRDQWWARAPNYSTPHHVRAHRSPVTTASWRLQYYPQNNSATLQGGFLPPQISSSTVQAYIGCALC